MKKVAQALGKPHFDQLKEYHRFLEELEESYEQVKRIRQVNHSYKRSMRRILTNYDKEVREASKALDRGKHFVKWSIQ